MGMWRYRRQLVIVIQERDICLESGVVRHWVKYGSIRPECIRTMYREKSASKEYVESQPDNAIFVESGGLVHELRDLAVVIEDLGVREDIAIVCVHA